MKIQIVSIVVLVLCAIVSGCATSDAVDLLDPAGDNLSGTWDYQIMNAYESQFTGCEGDAGLLEGLTFYEGFAVAPLCSVPTTFQVLQVGDVLQVVPDMIDCSGSPAELVGTGSISETELDGQWQIASSDGVIANHTFLGTANGNAIEINESARTFHGTFSGSCDLDPPLNAVATIR